VDDIANVEGLEEFLAAVSLIFALGQRF